METLVIYILCWSTRCSLVQNTYILSTPPGWLDGMLILLMKSPNKSPYEHTDHYILRHRAIKDIYLQTNNKSKLLLK